ncbi:fungal hydrophobin-domain-containing protein [Suillus subaureus]|uniref:Hydrophobin n=1 Tax=Suillus subaureus TaxID=48587 RepID=A0A9P7JEZ2_9AGAM|nr:fungal hydrophobin-domain-containing protein [Suillus subaureus]KAG1819209.1 fungal hydrophobin-domain-containing protein [Suillus subaureus]
MVPFIHYNSTQLTAYKTLLSSNQPVLPQLSLSSFIFFLDSSSPQDTKNIMKFASVLALAVTAAVVSAETNADRMARGLPPLAPARRGTPVARAKRTAPSGGSGQCNTGTIQCCDSVTNSGHGSSLDELLSLLKIDTPVDTPCGVSCSPISAIGGSSGANCNQEPVCCENNSYNGLVNIGCSPSAFVPYHSCIHTLIPATISQHLVKKSPHSVFGSMPVHVPLFFSRLIHIKVAYSTLSAALDFSPSPGIAFVIVLLRFCSLMQ